MKTADISMGMVVSGVGEEWDAQGGGMALEGTFSSPPTPYLPSKLPQKSGSTPVTVTNPVHEIRKIIDEVLFDPDYVDALRHLKEAQAAVKAFQEGVRVAEVQIKALWAGMILQGGDLGTTAIFRGRRGTVVFRANMGPFVIDREFSEEQSS